MPHLPLRSALIALVVTGASGGFPWPAGAAPTCATPGTVQAAIDAAGPGQVVEVGPGTCRENLTIAKSITLRGAGVGATILDGSLRAASVISINGPASVVIEDLTITGGGGPSGGGLMASGEGVDALLLRVEVADNHTSWTGGGVEANRARVTIRDSTIHHNSVAYPGGEAPAGGGGIANWGGATMLIERSTIAANHVSGLESGGGGVYNGAALTVVNSTITGNDGNHRGGAIATFLGTVTIGSSTINGNAAGFDTTGFPARGGGIYSSGGSILMTNSILAGNSATVGPDCSMQGLDPGPLDSGGYNLLGDGDACVFGASVGDMVGSALAPIAPGLGPLGDNGGPTPTQALADGSPALDAIPAGSCVGITDQRGVTRPQGAGCDIGAYELAVAIPPAEVAGTVDVATGRWSLPMSGGTLQTFYYGAPGDLPVAGDWDGDGIDTPGLYRESSGFAYLRDSNTQGTADRQFYFGLPGDVPLAGDWDGDGRDTLAVYRAGQVFIRNNLGTGVADFTYYFGVAGDRPMAGDWDGDGIDEVGLYREATGLVYYRAWHGSGPADAQFYYGEPTDRFVGGDWDGDGIATPGVYRSSSAAFLLRTTNSQGPADVTVPWSGAGDVPVAGYFG